MAVIGKGDGTGGLCQTCYGAGTIVVKGEEKTCPACKGSGTR